jgi:hypothetical protein
LSTYLTYAAERRQLCWSHLRSNLLSAQELATTTSAKRFCREALTLQRQPFRLWYRFRADPHVRGVPLTRAQLIAYLTAAIHCHRRGQFVPSLLPETVTGK